MSARMLDAQELTEALGGKWRNGRGMAFCPAHQNTNTPSMSIREGDDHPVVFHCFTGCHPNEIIAALQAQGLWPQKGEKKEFIPHPAKPKAPEPPPPDFEGILFAAWSKTTDEKIGALAEALGVCPLALARLRPARGQHWAFAMKDGEERVVGIRVRADNGKKWAVTGSRNGLFIPAGIPDRSELWVCEGPTDTAAALTLGFQAIGRASCNSCDDMVVTFVRRRRVRRVLIIADADAPGMNGADKLQETLPVPSVIWIPPGVKDVRKFVQAGGTRETVECMLRGKRWHKAKEAA